MSKSKNKQKQFSAYTLRRRNTKRPQLPAFVAIMVLGIASVLAIGLVVALSVGNAQNIAIASTSPSSSKTPGYGSLNHVKGPCGNTKAQPACPIDQGWFPISSASAGLSASAVTTNVVAAAITTSRDFKSMQSRFAYVALDAPVIVHAYQAHTGIEYYDSDHWITSVRNAAGRRVGVFDFVYDRAHQRMRFSSFGVIPAEDPHYAQAFPYISTNTVASQLHQRGLALAVSSQPELIFFALDARYRNLNSTQYRWSGGGDSPMNPIWHTLGADGQDYFVGVDLNTYTRKDIPMAAAMP